MRTNSSRVVAAAADYIESLYQQGKKLISLQTFSGEYCVGVSGQPEIERYAPLKVSITVIDNSTSEHQTFDLSDVESINPV